MSRVWRNRIAHRDRIHARPITQQPFQLQKKHHLTFRGVVVLVLQGHGCGQGILRLHSELLMLQIPETSQKQHAACQQHHACRDLADHQPLAHLRSGATDGRAIVL